MANFEEELNRFKGRAMSDAERHTRMLREHATISRDRALGFVGLMNRHSVTPEPVRMHLEKPTSVRKGLLSPRLVAGPINHEFPMVGTGWAIQESEPSLDWGKYWVVLTTAETVVCQQNRNNYPNQPSEPYHNALFTNEGGVAIPNTVPSPFFYDSDYEKLQHAAIRLTS